LLTATSVTGAGSRPEGAGAGTTEKLRTSTDFRAVLASFPAVTAVLDREAHRKV